VNPFAFGAGAFSALLSAIALILTICLNKKDKKSEKAVEASITTTEYEQFPDAVPFAIGVNDTTTLTTGGDVHAGDVSRLGSDNPPADMEPLDFDPDHGD